jgi:uncharacterized surface protein with fasciclin (FAS1) repeats
MFSRTRIVLLPALLALALATTLTACSSNGAAGSSPSPTVTPSVVPSVVSGTVTEAAQSGDLGGFLTAVTAAGLQTKLQEAGQFTVFAPNKQAFGAVSLDQLGQGRRLRDVVGYHIVPGQNIQLSAIQSGATFVTDEGAPLTITFDGGATLVNDATVVAAYAGTDWTLYVIDRVLFPPTASSAP